MYIRYYFNGVCAATAPSYAARPEGNPFTAVECKVVDLQSSSYACARIYAVLTYLLTERLERTGQLHSSPLISE